MWRDITFGGGENLNYVVANEIIALINLNTDRRTKIHTRLLSKSEQMRENCEKYEMRINYYPPKNV